jgi:hypothetical protein
LPFAVATAVQHSGGRWVIKIIGKWGLRLLAAWLVLYGLLGLFGDKYDLRAIVVPLLAVVAGVLIFLDR